MIRIFSYSRESKRMETPAISDLPRHLADRGRMIWADLEDPSDEETGVLGGIFGFHVLAVEDCMQGNHLPKMEPYDGYTFLVVHAVDEGAVEGGFGTQEVDVFVGENYLVTYHKRQVKSIFDTRGQVAKNPGSLLRTPDWLLQCIVDGMLDNYGPPLRHMEQRVSDLEAGASDLSRAAPPGVAGAQKLRQEAFHLHRIAVLERSILDQIRRGEPTWVAPENQVYFRNLYSRMGRILQTAEGHRESVQGAMETQLLAISIHASRAVRILTAVVSAMMPLTLIAAIYGMNLRALPGLEWDRAWVLVLVVMVVVGVGIPLALKKRLRL